jgi:hypothetical protein
MNARVIIFCLLQGEYNVVLQRALSRLGRLGSGKERRGALAVNDFASFYNERRLDACRCFAADAFEAATGAVFSFDRAASSCLRRSMNQRPAGPGGLSVR